MSTVSKIAPKEKGLKVRTERALRPFGHGMEEFFENFFENFPRRWAGSFTDPFRSNLSLWRDMPDISEVEFPRVEMIDREKDLVVRVELPGVRKEDLEISIHGDRLMIEAKREYKEEEKDETWFRSEMGYGAISRTVMLPVDVDEATVKAILKDGILELKLPKVEVHKKHVIKVA